MRPQLLLLLLLVACSKKPQQLPEINSRIDSLLTSACEYPHLSNQFIIKTKFNRYIVGDTQDSCTIQLYITDKTTRQVVDSLSVTSGFLLDKAFTDCKNAMSYSTRYNTDKEIIDNDYGDIVVADLNFDGKEDIAVTNDSGGNGGSFYSYFIQTNAHTFSLNKFLTDSMIYFPTKMNDKERTLVTYVHAGVCGLSENVYQLDEKNNHWKSKSHQLMNICDK